MSKVKTLHSLVELIPAPGLLLARLANYWGHKACSAGREYLASIEAGTQEIDLSFLADHNNEINHVFGFDKYKVPGVFFRQRADAYVYCYYENRRLMINSPYDEADSIEKIVQFRRNNQSNPKAKSTPFAPTLTKKEQEMLNLLTTELGQTSQEKNKVTKEQVLDFVLAEIKPLMTVLSGQDAPATYSNWAELDNLMPEEDKERLIGCCYKEPLTDKLIREGIRGSYSFACANLARAMYNEENYHRLSGILFDMQSSWHIIMEKKYD